MFKKVNLAILFSLIFISSVYGYNFKYGFSERLRHEFRKNISDLENNTKDNRNYFRIKTCLWAQMDFRKDLNLYARLANENTPYTYWAGALASAGKSASKKGYHYDINEVVFDNLYLDANNLIGLPLDLRLGRQDFGSYGEGFLLKDGTPNDAARTYYFNGAKANWRINTGNTLEFLFIKDNKTDDLLPIINRLDGEQALNSSNEIAYILYHKSDAVKNLHLENYYIFKREKAAGETSSSRMTREKTKLNTLGSFGQYKFSPWTLRSQFAFQFGNYGKNDREGLGGYAFLDRDFKNFKWTPQASLGFIYLSGDDRDTAKNEAWNPLFSRWPWLPEVLGIYYGSETQAYYWANLQAYQASLVFVPTPKTKLTLQYYFLRANENVAPTATLFSGSGKNRGHLPNLKIDYAINKNITTYFLANYFIPENFYVDSADEAIFLRAELQIKF